MIIGIHSAIGEGKDTVAKLLIEQNPQFVNKKFADKLKEIIALLTGCTREDLEKESFKSSLIPEPWRINGKRITYRFMLQYMGTEIFREKISNDVWVNSLFSDYKEEDKFIITDVRFKSEFDAIKERGGINVLLRRTQTVEGWDKYFKEYGIKIPRAYRTDRISKQDFVTLAYKYREIRDKKEFVQKFLHRSERELHELLEKEEIEFDYVIENNGGLDLLSSKVNKFSNYFLNQTK